MAKCINTYMKTKMKSTEYYISGQLIKNALKGSIKGHKTQKIQALKRINLYLENPSFCSKCNSPLSYKQRKNKFCSNSCSALFNNVRKFKKIYSCLFCEKENKHNSSKTNKFCNNICQGKWRWLNITVPQIEAGAGAAAQILKKYLIYKYGEHCFECNIGPEWNKKILCLQIDHIDGNSDNNQVTNLRLLCPNCHTQTKTWGSKGQGNIFKKATTRNLYSQNRRQKKKLSQQE